MRRRVESAGGRLRLLDDGGTHLVAELAGQGQPAAGGPVPNAAGAEVPE